MLQYCCFLHKIVCWLCMYHLWAENFYVHLICSHACSTLDLLDCVNRICWCLCLFMQRTQLRWMTCLRTTCGNNYNCVYCNGILKRFSLNDNLFENSSHETLVEMCAAMSMCIQTWISRFENTNMILKIALNRVLLATTLRYIIKYIRERNKTGFNQPKKIFTTCFCHRNTIYFKLRMHHSWVDILILRINVSNHDFFFVFKQNKRWNFVVQMLWKSFL